MIVNCEMCNVQIERRKSILSLYRCNPCEAKVIKLIKGLR